MQFGFCIMSDIDEIGFFSFIEKLGFASAWVADSQMMFSDVYAVCTLAAQLGTSRGVMHHPSLRGREKHAENDGTRALFSTFCRKGV